MSVELRPTPETDAACWLQDHEIYRGEIINSNFARNLERQRDEAREQWQAEMRRADDKISQWAVATTERDEAREELAKAKSANAKHTLSYLDRICEICGHTKGHDDPECPNCLKSELAKAQAQVLALREALVECRGYIDRFGQDGVRERADKVLAGQIPPVVKLEDVRPLVEAVAYYASCAACGALSLAGGDTAEKALKTFLTTCPQLS